MSDFAITPDFEIVEEMEYKNLVTEFENGVEQRRAVWQSPRHRFTLSYRNRPLADYESLRDFFISKKGTLLDFTYTSLLDGDEYTVRFSDDNFEMVKSTPNTYNFSLKLQEVK